MRSTIPGACTSPKINAIGTVVLLTSVVLVLLAQRFVGLHAGQLHRDGAAQRMAVQIALGVGRQPLAELPAGDLPDPGAGAGESPVTSLTL